MKAVILAAGSGKRIKTLAKDVPKPLLRLTSQTILDILLEKLKEVGIESLVLVVAREHLDAFRRVTLGWDMDIRLFVQLRPLGTADALKSTQEFLPGQDAFLLLYGDQVFDFSLQPLIDYYKSNSFSSVFIIEKAPSGRKGNRVKLKDNKVIAIKEYRSGSPAGYSATGICILPGKIFRYLDWVKPAEDKEFYLTGAIDCMLQEGEPAGFFHIPGGRINLNTPEDVEEARLLLAK